MKAILRIIPVFVLCFCTGIASYCSSVNDTIEIFNLFEKVRKESSSDIVKAKENCLKIVDMSKDIKNEKWEVKSLNLLGVFNYMTGDYDSALTCYNKALEISEKINYEEFTYKIVGNLGLLYSKTGDYDKAIEMLFISLELCEKKNDSLGMARKYADIGNTYQYLNNYKKSYIFLDRALKIFYALKDSIGQSNVLNSLGSVLHEKKDYKQALQFYRKSLDLKLKLGEKKGAVNCYNNIAYLLMDQNKSDESLLYFFKALDLSKEVNDKENIVVINNNIGTVYKDKKDYSKAESYFKESLETAREINMLMMVKISAMNLSEVYDSTEDYKKALEYNRLYYKTKIELSDVDINSKINEIEAKYETEKKDKELIKKDAELAIKQADASKKEMQRNAFIAGFVIILISSFMLLRLFIQKKKANRLLARQNIEIKQQKEEISTQRDEIVAQRDLVTTQKEKIEEIYHKVSDSITYAKRIQTAVLPSGEYAGKIMGEHFILFLPKDVVSGDFYWATKVNEWLIITVADCTGHGVPGAFMSMLGISYLNEIVRKKEVTKASQVLNQLRDSVIEALKQSGVAGEQKDGMDIALAVINTNTLEMQFAGANNPLYIVGSKQYVVGSESPDCQLHIANCLLTELKGDKMPVAIYERMKDFTNNVVQLQKGDIIYMTSDGYEDQFGGPKQRKFLSKNLRDLILSNSHLTMQDQKEILHAKLVEWKGDNEQIDDITIMGIKI